MRGERRRHLFLLVFCGGGPLLSSGLRRKRGLCNPVVEDFGDINCCRVKKREGELRLVVVVLLWSFDLDLWCRDASEVDIVDKGMGV
jgi:hypothetical protein